VLNQIVLVNDEILKITPVYIILVVFLYMLMYRKTTNFFIFVLESILVFVAGVFMSYIVSLLGLELVANKYFLLLIPITLLFAYLNKRYVCLAYTGSMLGIMALCFPKMDIDIIWIIGIVGVLHLLEGILLLITLKYEYKREVIYLKQKLKLGYVLEKMWIVPVVITYPVLVILGFSEKESSGRIPRSANRLIIYALTLIFIYICSKTLDYMEVVGLVVMPLMHERMASEG